MFQYVPPVLSEVEEFKNLLDGSKNPLALTDKCIDNALSGVKNDEKSVERIRSTLKDLKNIIVDLNEMKAENRVPRSYEVELNSYIFDVEAAIVKAEDVSIAQPAEEGESR